jgi:hypothetical protein
VQGPKAKGRLAGAQERGSEPIVRLGLVGMLGEKLAQRLDGLGVETRVLEGADFLQLGLARAAAARERSHSQERHQREQHQKTNPCARCAQQNRRHGRHQPPRWWAERRIVNELLQTAKTRLFQPGTDRRM